MSNAKSFPTRILVECAVFVTIASVLCMLKLPVVPYGGSVTFCSMLPIIVISYRRGLRWGLLSGFVFSLVQLLTGGFKTAGFTLFAIVIVLLFDYLIAFTVLGLGGMFRGKLGGPAKELSLGAFVVILLRYACHVLSGYVVWGEYAEWFFSQTDWGAGILARFSGGGLALIYSLIYNATYMLPELIITVTVAAFVSKWALYGIEPEGADPKADAK